MVFENETHSLHEKIYLLWGVTGRGRKPAVVFTIRKNKVRIISARDMTGKERKSKGERAIFPNLKPSTESISLRLPKYLPARIKELANAEDVPYQSFMKVLLAKGVREKPAGY